VMTKRQAKNRNFRFVEEFNEDVDENGIKKERNRVRVCFDYFLGMEGFWQCPIEGSVICDDVDVTPRNNGPKNTSSSPSSLLTTKKHKKKSSSSAANNQLIITEHDVHLYRLALPLLEPYTDRFPKFWIAEILVILGIALSNIIGALTASCFAQGAILMGSVGIYGLVTLVMRPNQERFYNYGMPVISALQCAIVGYALDLKTEEQLIEVDLEIVAGIALALSICQFLVAIATTVAFLLPVFDSLVSKYKMKMMKQQGGDSTITESKNDSAKDKSNDDENANENQNEEMEEFFASSSRTKASPRQQSAPTINKNEKNHSSPPKEKQQKPPKSTREKNLEILHSDPVFTSQPIIMSPPTNTSTIPNKNPDNKIQVLKKKEERRNQKLADLEEAMLYELEQNNNNNNTHDNQDDNDDNDQSPLLLSPPRSSLLTPSSSRKITKKRSRSSTSKKAVAVSMAATLPPPALTAGALKALKKSLLKKKNTTKQTQ